jgi:hypothetical protein
MHGYKKRSISEKDRITLNMWKRNILRKLYRSVIEQGVRRIRTDQELRELCKPPDLVADIKGRMSK